MTTFDQTINIPEGFILRRIGGRPKNTARDIAIFLARHWRTERFSELVRTADDWIMERWTKDGINDPAHIRRSIGKARADMNKTLLTFSDEFAMALITPLAEGSPGWFWREGMTKALPIQAHNFSAKVTRDVLHMSPTAMAASRLCTNRS